MGCASLNYSIALAFAQNLLEETVWATVGCARGEPLDGVCVCGGGVGGGERNVWLEPATLN